LCHKEKRVLIAIRLPQYKDLGKHRCFTCERYWLVGILRKKHALSSPSSTHCQGLTPSRVVYRTSDSQTS
jgi:hypothetical protein